MAVGAKSLAATISTSASASRTARRKLRPMRPKPFDTDPYWHGFLLLRSVYDLLPLICALSSLRWPGRKSLGTRTFGLSCA